MINLPNFKWWLKGPVAKAWRLVAGAVWQGFETFAEDALRSASIEHATATGFELIKKDLVIPPPAGMSDLLQRIFVQYYRDILTKNATPECLDLVPVILGLSFWRREPMRYSPLAADYPLATVRFWVPPLSTGDLALVEEMLRLMLPARCVHLYQIQQSDETGGFGVAPFGTLY